MNLKERGKGNIEGKGRENCNYNIKNKIKILSKKRKNFTVEERGTRDS